MSIDTLTYIVFILLFIVFVLILAIAVSLMRCQRAVEEVKKNLIQTPSTSSPVPEKKSTSKSILKKPGEKPCEEEKKEEKPAGKHVSFDPEPLILDHSQASGVEDKAPDESREPEPPTNAKDEGDGLL